MSEAALPSRSRSRLAGRAGLLWLNALGGLAVLASYGLLFTRADASAVLWGGVPESLRPLYTTNMLLAAAGYFPFTALLVLASDPARVRFFGRFGQGALYWLYGLVLIPSALWMPLTFAYVDAPSAAGWWLVRADLALAGLGSLGLLGCTLTVQPRPARWLQALAVLGCLFFCLQTAVLDATLWPAWYPPR